MSPKEKHADSTKALHEKLKIEQPETEGDEGEEQVELLEHPSYIEMQKKLTETEEKMNQYWDRCLRLQAENDNTLRRVERDIANAHKYALEKFVSELLPIVDNLERAVTSATDDNSVLEGVRLTLKMFITAFEKFGVQQVDPEAQAFNPELHQAVSAKADGSVAPNTVLNVLQKGYTLNNRLIRPALVVVAKAP